MSPGSLGWLWTTDFPAQFPCDKIKLDLCSLLPPVKGAQLSHFRTQPIWSLMPTTDTHTLCLCPQLYDMLWGIMQYFTGRHNHFYDLLEEHKDFFPSKVNINETSFDPSNSLTPQTLGTLSTAFSLRCTRYFFLTVSFFFVKPIFQLLEEKRKSTTSY